ncbi:hypothetical protein, partial [Ralstonia pseudosolanacearum]|uniref:hypothetical protein n=1 Tax=Ralstonia pseudosolanacearum TaxID=1310165 RepID=UPI003CEDC839
MSIQSGSHARDTRARQRRTTVTIVTTITPIRLPAVMVVTVVMVVLYCCGQRKRGYPVPLSILAMPAKRCGALRTIA